MDYGVLIFGVIAIAVLLWWIMLEPLMDKQDEEPVKAELPSDAELNKLTKAKLEELGREHGIELDKRKTKAKMIADLKNA